jgi:nitrogen regulatory protein PII
VKIFVKEDWDKGVKHTFKVELTDTTDSLMVQIRGVTGFKKDDQRIFAGEEQMKDWAKLCDYNIKCNDMLKLRVRGRGGARRLKPTITKEEKIKNLVAKTRMPISAVAFSDVEELMNSIHMCGEMLQLMRTSPAPIVDILKKMTKEDITETMTKAGGSGNAGSSRALQNVAKAMIPELESVEHGTLVLKSLFLTMVSEFSVHYVQKYSNAATTTAEEACMDHVAFKKECQAVIDAKLEEGNQHSVRELAKKMAMEMVEERMSSSLVAISGEKDVNMCD